MYCLGEKVVSALNKRVKCHGERFTLRANSRTSILRCRPRRTISIAASIRRSINSYPELFNRPILEKAGPSSSEEPLPCIGNGPTLYSEAGGTSVADETLISL